MLQGISLEWWRDARGYRLEEEQGTRFRDPTREPPLGGVNPPYDAASAFNFPEGWWAAQPKIPGRIVRAGGRQISYRPIEMLDQIFNAYINTEPTPQGLLGFINRFGPFTRFGLDENFGESVEFAINNLNYTTDLIEAFGKTDKADQRRALATQLGPDGLVTPSIKVRVLFDEQTQTLRTEHVVQDLASALWLRLLEIQASDIVMRKCGHCGAWFTAGMGTGRHLNARFCTDEHRIAFNSLKRTPKAA
jgi:hypothetical protein